MPSAPAPLPYEVTQAVRQIGSSVRIARQRRRMHQQELARKAGVNDKTLRRLEQGDGGVSLGNVLSILWALGMLPAAAGLAHPDSDEHGKTLELARLPKRVREAVPDNDF
jgi:transcriptional regulator with XRE-family HTH domain